MAEQIGEVVLGISIPTSAFEAGLNRCKQLANNAGQAIVNGISGGSGNSLTGLNIKLNTLQQELQNVQIGTKRFRELRKEIDATQQALDRASGAGRGGVLGGVVAGIAGLGVGAAAFGFLKGSIDEASQLETITKKLSNTLGQQGAGKALAFTKGLSDELGLSFKTLASSFSGFTAAASAASVPLQVQRELFAAVSKAAQQLGLSNDEINGSLLALQQIASKGTVQMEELRGQLGERLPIAFGAAAKGLGITQQELIKLVETGRLTSAQFFPALTKGLNELTTASAGAPTTAQNLQVLQNKWQELQASFGVNLLPAVTESVKALTAVLDGLGRKSTADRLGFQTGGAGLLGILSDQAIAATVAYEQVQKQFNLTNKEADRLFSTAAKNSGVRNLAFATPEDVQRVTAEYARLSEQYRKINVDRQEQLQLANAEAEKLRLSALARADADTKILGPSRDQLEAVRLTVGLQGLALTQAQEALKIDKARAAEKKAIANFDKALSAAGFDRNAPGVIDASAKMEAAGNSLKAALIEGSDRLQQAAKDAAQRFIDASKQLTTANLALSENRGTLSQGLNRFLTSEEQSSRLQAAIVRLGPELQRAITEGQKLLNAEGVGLGRPVFQSVQDIFENARTGRFISQDSLTAVTTLIRDVQQAKSAVSEFNSAQKTVDQINAELAGVNKELRDQVAALVQKDWTVQVNLNGTSGAQVLGDVVGAF